MTDRTPPPPLRLKACRSVFMERRRPYDPKVMRAKGTPLEFFQKPIGENPFLFWLSVRFRSVRTQGSR